MDRTQLCGSEQRDKSSQRQLTAQSRVSQGGRSLELKMTQMKEISLPEQAGLCWGQHQGCRAVLGSTSGVQGCARVNIRDIEALSTKELLS